MISKDSLINSIFYTRTTTCKDEKDHLVEVDDNISVGVRLYFNDKTFNKYFEIPLMDINKDIVEITIEDTEVELIMTSKSFHELIRNLLFLKN